jgi:hypothetical protein
MKVAVTARGMGEPKMSVKMSVKMRQIVEREIATAIVNILITEGFRILVDYGENDRLHTRKSVLAAMFQGDEDRLFLYKNGKIVGWVYLVYGNSGWDVLSDYSVNLEKLIGDGTAVAKIIDKYAD